MKIFNKLASVLMVLPMLVALTACSDDDGKYTPAEKLANAQVFFSNELPSTQDIAIDGTSFVVPINRVNTDGELTVQLNVEQDEASLFNIPSSVTFADGESVAYITITYDPATQEYDALHPITISIAEESYTTPYGDTSYTFQAGPLAPWEDMGNAIYREDLISTWYGVDNLEYEVPIQKNSLVEGLYRLVNPYGATYPYNDPGDWDTSKDYYMVVHAEDPEFVWVEESNTGTDWGKGNFNFISYVAYFMQNGNSLEAVKAARPDLFGKLENGVITMPQRAMLGWRDSDDGLYYCNVNGKFAIALPGASLVEYDYSANALYAGILKTPAETYQGVVDLTLGADVASAKYAMTSADVSEEEAAAAIVAGELEAEEITENTRVYLPLEEDGKYRVTVVTFDEEGEVQESASCVFEFVKGESPWQSLGMALYTDDIVGPLFEADPVTYEVEVFEHKDNPGLYRLKNAYGEGYPYNEEGDWDASMDYYLEIDATDPTSVYFEEQELGLDWGYGMMSAVSDAARYLAIGYDIETIKANGIEFGSLVDGVITFPVKGIIAFDDDGGYYANTNGAFKLVLPGAASESGIKAAKFARRLRGERSHTRSCERIKRMVGLKTPVNAEVNKFDTLK
ncbi:MAG: hypothetical protein J6Y04_09140 [Bacteroidaceae bacterium]|nr:hypothetical protein [Bacteroidaceae bacterium]